MRGKGCPQNESRHRRREIVHSEYWQVPSCKQSNKKVLAPFPISLPFFLFQLPQSVTLVGEMARVKEAHGPCATTEGWKSPQEGRNVSPQAFLSYFQAPPRLKCLLHNPKIYFTCTHRQKL